MIGAETIMTDMTERMGVGGDYLKERITRDRIRAGKHFYPTIGGRLPYEKWAAEGRMETDVSREKAAQILAEREEQARPGGAAFFDTDQL
jgi:trimethylamine:corrinoid methyltransferase-like protein